MKTQAFKLEHVTCIECRHHRIKDFVYGYCNVGRINGIIKPWFSCGHGVRAKDTKKRADPPRGNCK